MIIRPIASNDREMLDNSLHTDSFHQGTTSDFFYESGTLTNIYEDEVGPIFAVKGSPTIRIDIQFINNNDYERNRKALEDGFGPFVERAKLAGFKELVFCSDSPLLRAFCKRKFGFKEVSGELRKFI